MFIYMPTTGAIVALVIPIGLIIAACKHAYDAYQNKKAHQRLNQRFQRYEEFMEQDPGYRAARSELKRIEIEIERMRKAMDPHDELYELHRSELYALYRAERKAMDDYDVRWHILHKKFCENQKTS